MKKLEGFKIVSESQPGHAGYSGMIATIKRRNFFLLLNHARRLKYRGWDLHPRRLYLAGMYSEFIENVGDLIIAENIRQTRKREGAHFDPKKYKRMVKTASGTTQ